MSNQENANNTAIAESAQFILPTVTESIFTTEDLAEDMEGLQLTFPKVKIPGGGVLQFEVSSDDPERPNYVPELEGILLFNHPANACWQEGGGVRGRNPAPVPVFEQQDRLRQSGRPVRQLRLQHVWQRQQGKRKGV